MRVPGWNEMADKVAEDLIDLQSRLAFQQASIDALHLTIARQENAIAILSEELRRLRTQIDDLAPPEFGAAATETPPHY